MNEDEPESHQSGYTRDQKIIAGVAVGYPYFFIFAVLLSEYLK